MDFRNFSNIEGLCTQLVNHLLQKKDDCKNRRSHLMTDSGSVRLSLLRSLFLLVLLHLKDRFAHIFCLIADVYCKCRLSSIALLSELNWNKAVLNICFVGGLSLLVSGLRHDLEKSILKLHVTIRCDVKEWFVVLLFLNFVYRCLCVSCLRYFQYVTAYRCKLHPLELDKRLWRTRFAIIKDWIKCGILCLCKAECCGV